MPGQFVLLKTGRHERLYSGFRMFIIVPIPGGAANVLRMFILAGIFVLIPLAAFTGIGLGIYKEYRTQSVFRDKYGADWQAQYEQKYGPGSLQKARIKIVVGAAGVPVIGTILGLLIWQAKGPDTGGSPRRRRKRSKRKEHW
jgi:hypothetical protein